VELDPRSGAVQHLSDRGVEVFLFAPHDPLPQVKKADERRAEELDTELTFRSPQYFFGLVEPPMCFGHLAGGGGMDCLLLVAAAPAKLLRLSPECPPPLFRRVSMLGGEKQVLESL